MREVQVPHTPSPVCTHPPPPPPITGTQLHMRKDQPCFDPLWAQRGQCVRRAPRPPGDDSVVRETVSEIGIYGQEGTGLSQGKRNRLRGLEEEGRFKLGPVGLPRDSLNRGGGKQGTQHCIIKGCTPWSCLVAATFMYSSPTPAHQKLCPVVEARGPARQKSSLPSWSTEAGREDRQEQVNRQNHCCSWLLLWKTWGSGLE